MKNWKNNRGILLNQDKQNNILKEDNVVVNNIFNYNIDDFILKDIKLKRIVDLEFSDIKYVDKIGIKKYFKWNKM